MKRSKRYEAAAKLVDRTKAYTVDEAVKTVIQTIQLGVPVARIELLDPLAVHAINAYSKAGLRESPMLFFEFHGSDASVREQAEIVQEVARSHGGQDF